MFTRIVFCDSKPEKIQEYQKVVTNNVLPEMQRQPGFIDLIHATDPQTGRTVGISFWKTREDADRYGKESFTRVFGLIQPFMKIEPTIHTMEVDCSTVHKIAIGKAA